MGDGPRIDIDMENVKEQVTVVFPRPASIDFAGIAEAVKESGHRLEALEADLSGRVVQTSEGVQLRLDGTGQQWPMDASTLGTVPPDGLPWKGRVQVQGWANGGTLRLIPLPAR